MNTIQMSIYNHVDVITYSYSEETVKESVKILMETFKKEEIRIDDCLKITMGFDIVNRDANAVLFTPTTDNRFIVISRGLSKEEIQEAVLFGMDRLSVHN